MTGCGLKTNVSGSQAQVRIDFRFSPERRDPYENHAFRVLRLTSPFLFFLLFFSFLPSSFLLLLLFWRFVLDVKEFREQKMG